MVKKLIPSFEIVLDAEYIKGNRERNVYADAARWKPWQRQVLQVSALLQNLLAEVLFWMVLLATSSPTSSLALRRPVGRKRHLNHED